MPNRRKTARKTMVPAFVGGLMCAVLCGVAVDGADIGLARADGNAAPVTNESYRKECGSCHFAYLPALLPARSWQLVLSRLDKHFGESVTLTPEQLESFRTYLTAGAADHNSSDLSRQMLSRVSDSMTPDRISTLPYMKRRHQTMQQIRNTKSIANCQSCHTKAAQGSFDSSEFEMKDPAEGSGMRTD